MISIIDASINDIKIIQDIAYTTWPLTYGEILSVDQLQYMLDLIYSDEVLTKQIKNKEQLFYLIYEEETVLGFIGIEHNYQNKAITKIHKIYLLAETQGKGIGKTTIETIGKLAKENNSISLLLNVNRFNKALHFYKKIGFKIIDEINIEIGNGFLMEDYVMEKLI
jgi:ribosomal protein S18 acetylase RimI-like enzyme